MNQAQIIHKINEGFGHDSIEESFINPLKINEKSLFDLAGDYIPKNLLTINDKSLLIWMVIV